MHSNKDPYAAERESRRQRVTSARRIVKAKRRNVPTRSISAPVPSAQPVAPYCPKVSQEFSPEYDLTESDSDGSEHMYFEPSSKKRRRKNGRSDNPDAFPGPSRDINFNLRKPSDEHCHYD